MLARVVTQASGPRVAGRLLAAGDAERERIEQDIDDGVQLHLTALRIRLRLAAETFHARGDTDAGAALAAFGEGVEQVIGEVRDVAQGIYPALLTSSGLGAALASAVRRAGRPVSVRARNVRRCRPEIEIAVYFTCLAAIDNAAKHAGPDAGRRPHLGHRSRAALHGLRLRYRVRPEPNHGRQRNRKHA